MTMSRTIPPPLLWASYPESAGQVRSMIIDADVASMMAAAGDGHYSSNWQVPPVRAVLLVVRQHALTEE
jgi:hypothetical protein